MVCETNDKHWCSLLIGIPEFLVGQQSLGDFKANVGLSYRRIRNVVTAKKQHNMLAMLYIPEKPSSQVEWELEVDCVSNRKQLYIQYIYLYL